MVTPYSAAAVACNQITLRLHSEVYAQVVTGLHAECTAGCGDVADRTHDLRSGEHHQGNFMPLGRHTGRLPGQRESKQHSSATCCIWQCACHHFAASQAAWMVVYMVTHAIDSIMRLCGHMISAAAGIHPA